MWLKFNDNKQLVSWKSSTVFYEPIISLISTIYANIFCDFVAPFIIQTKFHQNQISAEREETI